MMYEAIRETRQIHTKICIVLPGCLVFSLPKKSVLERRANKYDHRVTLETEEDWISFCCVAFVLGCE